MVLGGGIMLAVVLGYGLPSTVRLFLQSVAAIGSGQLPNVVDGLVVLIVEGGWQVLLISLLLRRWRDRKGGPSARPS
jgi:hypothetical protein